MQETAGRCDLGGLASGPAPPQVRWGACAARRRRLCRGWLASLPSLQQAPTCTTSVQSCSTARSMAVAPLTSTAAKSAPWSSKRAATSAASASAAQCSGVRRWVASRAATPAPLQRGAPGAADGLPPLAACAQLC